MGNITKKPTPSIWEKTTNLKMTYEVIPQNGIWHIIIVGAGLAGLWLAYHLKNKYKKIRILILERGSAPIGASTRNAGFACFCSPTGLLSNLRNMREDDVWATIEMRIKGIEMIRDVLGDQAIDYNPCGGYECLQGPANSFSVLGDQIEMLNLNLYKITKQYPVFKISDSSKMDKLGLTGFNGMIENKMEGSLNSGKLVKSLRQKLNKMGVEMCPDFEAKRFSEGKDSVRVMGERDTYFTGRKVFLCTNAFTKSLLPDCPITPARGQIIVSSAIPNLSLNGTFHSDEGFYYWRNFGNRVLLGGSRKHHIVQETTTALDISNDIQCELEQFMKEHILLNVNDYTITDRWSGIMAFTNSNIPMMYASPLYDSVYSIIGCNGMGVSTLPYYVYKMVENFLI